MRGSFSVLDREGLARDEADRRHLAVVFDALVHFLEPLCAPLPDLLEGQETCIARTQHRAEIVVESKRLEREREREREREPALLPVV